MLSKLLSLASFALIAFAGNLIAIDYEVNDIGTLQTHSSHPIAINDKGQILGWYDLDGSGQRFFLRDPDGTFREIEKHPSNWNIDWKYLTNTGKVYGTFNGVGPHGCLLAWDSTGGICNLGNLPGREIRAINDMGQVLIEYVAGSDPTGKAIQYPVIWQNGVITKLRGLVGNLGLESEMSYGFDMNNNGDVVGQSVVQLVYKNKIYKQSHAVLWKNGQAIDLHNNVPKAANSSAKAITDGGSIMVNGHCLNNDLLNFLSYQLPGDLKSSSKHFYNRNSVFDENGNHTSDLCSLVNIVLYDYDCIWLTINEIVGVNENNEIVAVGTTVWGEQHAILISPIDASE